MKNVLHEVEQKIIFISWEGRRAKLSAKNRFCTRVYVQKFINSLAGNLGSWLSEVSLWFGSLKNIESKQFILSFKHFQSIGGLYENCHYSIF